MTQWGLDTLFNPAKRHMDEEKRRLQSTRSEVGDNSGGRRIDLASGKVKIRRTDGDDAAKDADDDAAAEDVEQDTADGSDTAPAVDKPAPSAAAIRAAKRRGRTPR